MDRPPELLRQDRVELRRWRIADADVAYRVVTESLDHLRPWMPWAESHSPDASLEFVTGCERDWSEGTSYDYAVRAGGSTVGSCGLMRRIGPGALEIGYWIHPSWTGRGLATSAAAALVRAAFALPGIGAVEIHHDEANEASGKVARRLGFTEAGRRAAEEPATPAASGVEVVWRLHRESAEAAPYRAGTATATGTGPGSGTGPDSGATATATGTGPGATATSSARS